MGLFGPDKQYGSGRSEARGAWKDYQHYAETATAQKNKGRASDAVNFFVGGPVGWGKMATGEGGIGGNFGEHRADAGLSEEDFYLMNDDEHDKYENLNQNQRAAFLVKVRASHSKEDLAAAKQKAAEDKLESDKTAREGQQKDLIAKVTAFANEMNMPVSELMQKDEFAKALNTTTYNNMVGQGMNTGAGVGGLSQVNADMATKRALLGYQGQRQAAGQAAYNNAFGMINNMGLQAENLARYNQGMNLQMQETEAQRRAAEYQQGLGKQQGMGGMIGGIAGAYFGGPTGAAMGQQVGSQMAGQRYQSQNPYKPYQFTYPSSAKQSVGLGGTKYGGNY